MITPTTTTISTATRELGVVNPRMLRIVRIFRILRTLRAIRILKSLQVLIRHIMRLDSGCDEIRLGVSISMLLLWYRILITHDSHPQVTPGTANISTVRYQHIYVDILIYIYMLQ